MPKQKSHSGAKKRVKRSGTGKLKMRRGRRNHLLQQKSKRQKRLNRTLIPSKCEERVLKKLLPYL